MPDWLLPHLAPDKIIAAYAAAPGKEIDSDKLSNPESSAALAANVFGYFLDRPAEFPLAAIFDGTSEAPCRVDLERELRFPWSGGLHPWLDAVVETDSWLIGVESKRYEPFRGCKPAAFSEAYQRDVWGDRMVAFKDLRDRLTDGSLCPVHLDCAQLVKHAFGIRTQAAKSGKRGALVYIYAEPATWPGGRTIPAADIEAHRAEMAAFSERVANAEVEFRAVPYRRLFDAFLASEDKSLHDHGVALSSRIAV